jgi:hypothetical protein
MGDKVANAIAVTPEREKRFAFSVPIQTNATRIVVSGPGFGSFSTLDELAGKEIHVNPLTIAYQELRRLKTHCRVISCTNKSNLHRGAGVEATNLLPAFTAQYVSGPVRSSFAVIF